MPIIELSTALVAAGSGLVVPFVNKVLEKSAQRLGGHVDEHLAALFTRAHEHLAATGREAQSVEPKLLKAVVENAPYETDPTLADHWAALLANAADPAQRVVVQPGFAEVLRQLTPLDAAVLARLYKQAVYKEADALYYELPSIVTRGMAAELEIADKQFAVSIETLLRLRLAAPPLPVQGGFDRATAGRAAAARQVCPTVFGFEFLTAVTPPTA